MFTEMQVCFARGWLVTRRCIEETCFMNPQNFARKLVAFTGSSKTPHKFCFQPPLSASSIVSEGRLHGKPEGDNIFESKRPHASTNACDRAELFDVR